MDRSANPELSSVEIKSIADQTVRKHEKAASSLRKQAAHLGEHRFEGRGTVMTCISQNYYLRIPAYGRNDTFSDKY
jgi:hypothetical protein